MTSTYATTTTAAMGYIETEPRIVIAGPSCSLSYLRTLSGMLKCIQIILCFLCFICVMVVGRGYFAGSSWTTFIALLGLMITASLLFLYLLLVVDNFPIVPWIVAEMAYCFTWSVFFFIAGCMLAIGAIQFNETIGWAIAAFFAFCCMFIYAFDCYVKFLAWKSNETATGRPFQTVL